MDTDLLRRGLAALSLPTEGPLIAGLSRYLAEIERLNPALGLVGAEGDELVIKHILDSLAPAAEIARLAALVAAGRGAAARAAPLSLADLGTGAGLPGVPLALALPELRVLLVDRMTRRMDFLRSTLPLVPVPNAEVLETQVEHARGPWDLVTFRAFRPFERKLFKRVFAACARDGYVLAYKGRMEKARAELPEIEGLYREAAIVPVSVPFLEEERCLVVLRPALSPGNPGSR